MHTYKWMTNNCAWTYQVSVQVKCFMHHAGNRNSSCKTYLIMGNCLVLQFMVKKGKPWKATIGICWLQNVRRWAARGPRNYRAYYIKPLEGSVCYTKGKERVPRKKQQKEMSRILLVSFRSCFN